jgi:hypothetical protein
VPTSLFSFETAAFEGQDGQRFRLASAQAEFGAVKRRAVRLRIRLKGRSKTGMKNRGVEEQSVAAVTVELKFAEVMIEMSRSEAYAFSEWLDAAVTRATAERGSTGRGNN